MDLSLKKKKNVHRDIVDQDFSQALLRNVQEVTQMEANVQGLIGTIVQAFLPKVNWSKIKL